MKKNLWKRRNREKEKERKNREKEREIKKKKNRERKREGKTEEGRKKIGKLSTSTKFYINVDNRARIIYNTFYLS